MKQGKEKSGGNPSGRRTRTARITFSEENYTILKELGADVGTHVNKAIEMYVRWIQDKESGEET